MPGKKVVRSKSSSPSKKKGSSSAKKRSRSSSPTKGKSKNQSDFPNSIALLNAYYVTHNASDGLDKFGYKWEGGKKKKKKKK